MGNPRRRTRGWQGLQCHGDKGPGMSENEARFVVSASESEDLALAYKFLSGSIINGRRRKGELSELSHEYIKPGSHQEREARAALARVLHFEAKAGNNLRSHILLTLALLFDPAEEREPRELVIKPRKTNKTGARIVDVQIAAQIKEARAKRGRGHWPKIEYIIADVGRRYGKSPSTVKRAFKKHARKASEES
jgi:hypothetical protein